jgi:hypothetical protein
VEGVVLVGKEEIERMKILLDRMLEKIAERKQMDTDLESIHRKIDRLDERSRNIETLLETTVNLIQELIFIAAGETLAVKEEQASVKQEEGEQEYELEEPPKIVKKVRVKEGEITRAGSWDLLGQRPKVSLHDLERELERLFSRMAEVEVAREEKRISENEYLMMMETLKEKKEKITEDLNKLFDVAQNNV